MLPASQSLGIDQCNCSAIRKASRQITRLYDAQLEPSSLRITQCLIPLMLLGDRALNDISEAFTIGTCNQHMARDWFKVLMS